MSATPRLFVESDLAVGREAILEGDPAHYLLRVLRLGPGSLVRLFNGRDGEFEGELVAGGKTAVRVTALSQIRPQRPTPDLWLLFAPLKKTRTDFIVEKATELGVSEIHPVLTDRCEAQAVRIDRLQRIAMEAAEQTERLDVPPVREAAGLDAVLTGWNPERRLYFCDEAGDEGGKPWGGEAGRAGPMSGIVNASAVASAAILIGPEGGFAQRERSRLRALPFVQPVGLGPRILRAETAAVAALVIWQAARGDWT